MNFQRESLTKIKLENIEKGIYILSVKTDKTTFNQQFVVE
ncbi:T9SS type A sorting domain-containing protein [Aureivirga sp. CE67]